jgi:hypothetical protein
MIRPYDVLPCGRITPPKPFANPLAKAGDNVKVLKK